MSTQSLWLMGGNPNLRARWNRWLTAEGWSVVESPNSEVLTRLPRSRVGPVLLDAALLKEDDMPVVRELSAAKIPVILFGEGPSVSDDRVVHWLEEGADDFIPASIREKLLVAKLEAYVRRLLPRMEPSVLYSPRRKIKVDKRRRLAWTRESADGWKLIAALTETEHRLLWLFLSNPEALLQRDFILEKLWGEKSAEIYSATLTQHLMSLRNKLGARGDSLRTVYGRGYMLLEEK